MNSKQTPHYGQYFTPTKSKIVGFNFFKVKFYKITILLYLLSTSSIVFAQSYCSINSLPELPEVTISSISQETDYAPHCKISGIIGKHIKFELLLPENWNRKFVFGGGGGFVGSVINSSLGFGVLQKGYATVGTDTGHEGHPIDASWALNDMEAILNFGHLAVHRTAVTSKAIIEAYYGKEITYSYFFGCSRGGGQAMMEAQRYPDDFDGIVAGAPAYNWTEGLGLGMSHNVKYMYPDRENLDEPLISAEDLNLIESAYLEMCDKLDGIVDGILTDPRACEFDVSSLLCEGQENENCLTKEKIDALKAIYSGPWDSEGNIYPGFPIGGETDPGGWVRWLTGGLKHIDESGEFQAGISSDFQPPVLPNVQFGFALGVMQYLVFHDTTWSYTDYDFTRFREDAQLAGNVLNATSPDLSKFRAHGGKLLMYTGWSDAAITALGTIAYFDDVMDHDPLAANDVKLFMMPGVMHCAGGPGPWLVNWVDEIDKWVAGQETPEQITVYFVDEDSQLSGSRLLCSYPDIAIYDGQGDTRDVSSFRCADSE